jgi:acyl CoA:acetate/3-ketoacid CoA transferase
VRAKSPTTGKWTEYFSYKNSGYIIITRKDEDNTIFSGTFYGKLKNTEGTETIEITDGRFDINKKKLIAK